MYVPNRILYTSCSTYLKLMRRLPSIYFIRHRISHKKYEHKVEILCDDITKICKTLATKVTDIPYSVL
jgi:hypothetical protein